MIKKIALAAALAALVAVVGVAGNYHFVYGSKRAAELVRKPSWTLSETVVNTDRLANLPVLIARAEYPLYLSHLEKRAEVERASRPEPSFTQPGAWNYTKGDVERVKIGMTLEQVQQVLGPRGLREASFEQGGVLVEDWRWMSPYTDAGILVRFRAGKVESRSGYRL